MARFQRESLRSIAFVARCAGAATLAFVIAEHLGFGHPVWATVSALVVSQDQLGDTQRSLLHRVAATLVGLAVAVAVTQLVAGWGASQTVIVALAVLICATVTRRWPDLRVSMWTSAIVVLTTVPGHSVVWTALERGGEVLIGGAVGAALHGLMDLKVFNRTRPRKTSTDTPSN